MAKIDSVITMEDIFDAVGRRGKWQILLFTVTSMSGFFNAFHHLGSIFLAATPDHRCTIPFYDTAGFHLGNNWTMEHAMKYAIPTTEDGFDQCHIYNRNYTGVFDQPWSSDLTISNGQRPPISTCTSWVYSKTDFQSTVVTQWDLVCDKKPLAATVQATYMIGVFFGTLVYGYVSDRYGRRMAIVFAALEFIVAPLLAAIPLHYLWFLLFRLLTGMGAGGIFTATFVLMSEFCSPDIRDVLGIAFQIPFSIGSMALAGIAFCLHNWTELQLFMGLLNTLVVLYYWLIPESPRWSILNGNYDDALKVLHRVAKVNGVKNVIDKDLLEMMKQFNKFEDTKRRDENRNRASNLSIVVDLFRTHQMRKRIFVSYFIWLSASLCYYGLSFKAPSLGNNRYLVAFLSALIEVPSYILGCVIIRHLPRRVNTIGTFIIGGVACLCILAVPVESTTTITVLALIGKFFVSITYAIIYLFTTEIFPTINRNVALGTSSMCARVGSTSAPYVVELLGGKLPMVIFGISSVLAGLLSFMLPETKDKSLPETVNDVENADDIIVSEDSELNLPPTVYKSIA